MRSRSTVSLMGMYIRDMDDYPPLPEKEQRELFIALANGDNTVRELLILSNMRLVIKFARQFLNKGLSFNDLVGEGNLGLVEAVDRYDCRAGAKFSTYARFWIRKAIMEALDKTVNPVQVAKSTHHLSLAWRNASAHLADTLERPPTEDEIVRKLITVRLENRLKRPPTEEEVDQEVVTLTKNKLALVHKALATHNVVSQTNTRAEDDEDLCYFVDTSQNHEDFVDEAEESEVAINSVYSALAQLPQSDRDILQMRFGLNGQDPKTFKEIGRKCGKSYKCIRQKKLPRAARRFREAYFRVRNRLNPVRISEDSPTNYQDEELIQQLRDLADSLGQVPTVKQIEIACRVGDCASYNTLRRHFGSREQIFRAAGLEPRHWGRPVKAVL